MQLLSEGLELEEFGGDVQCVQTAAKAQLGLRELEEALLLQVRGLGRPQTSRRPDDAHSTDRDLLFLCLHGWCFCLCAIYCRC